MSTDVLNCAYFTHSLPDIASKYMQLKLGSHLDTNCVCRRWLTFTKGPIVSRMRPCVLHSKLRHLQKYNIPSHHLDKASVDASVYKVLHTCCLMRLMAVFNVLRQLFKNEKNYSQVCAILTKKDNLVRSCKLLVVLVAILLLDKIST